MSAPTGTAGGVRGLLAALHAELRRVASTRLWWGLLIPVALLAAVVNLFGGLLGDATGDTGDLPVLLAAIAFTLTLVAVFAGVHGTVSAAGEFRHRTVTTAYLTAGGRGRVLVGKLVAGACVGGLYAAVAAVVGVGFGVVGQRGGRFPDVGQLLAVVVIGVVVAALWGVIGASLGTILGNQVGALVALLVYLQVGELVLASVLNNSGSEVAARLTPYLPGNAGDVAIYDLPAHTLAGQAFGDRAVEELAGVTAPPPWWGALSVLAAWALLAAVVAWTVADRRDVT
jgi:ABC-2 type transport system permease protein